MQRAFLDLLPSCKRGGHSLFYLNNMVNRTNIPTIPTLQKLCDAFGITLADFFLDEPDALQLTEGQQEIITLYNNLSLEKKKILKAYMKGLLMEV